MSTSLHSFLLLHVFFSTREMATHLGCAVASASRKLKRLQKEGSVESVTQGIWAQPQHPTFSPYGAIPYLLGNERGYLSFLTLLHQRGIISQIPTTIQIATTGRPRKLKSPIGVYEFFQLQPELFESGIVLSQGKLPYSMATPEKALLDTLYIASRKGNRFGSLPELDLSEINPAVFKKLLKSQILFAPIRTHIEARWRALIGQR